MNQTLSTTERFVRGLLWPERVPLDHAQRVLAEERLEQARARGLLDDAEAEQRIEGVSRAHHRGDLRRLSQGLPGMVAPADLVTVLRAASAVWLAVCLVHATIWVTILVVGGGWSDPRWMLWPGTVGAVFVGSLWWFTEAYYRRNG